LKLLFIHGAGASKDSFNFIEPLVDKRFERVFLQYDSNNGFKNNLQTMLESLDKRNKYFVISHSLGGLYAVYIAEYLNRSLRGSVSIASPFGGSDSATVLNMIKPCQLYKDISPYSDPIYTSQKIKIKCPWVQVVTTAGDSHWMNVANDGVVTKRSMMIRKDMRFVEVNSGHYEIMMQNRVVDVINTEINKTVENPVR
jgi:pimeloyl-ACP methyl ester carboxylesterase